MLNEAELAEADFEADADGLSSAAASVAEADAAAAPPPAAPPPTAAAVFGLAYLALWLSAR